MSRYIRTALTVEAIRLKEAITLSQDPAFGRSTGGAGDWMITEANGVQYIVSNSQFNDWFTPNDTDRLPATVITNDEGSPTTNRRPTWRWTIVPNATSYRYRLDGGSWVYLSNASFRVFTPTYDLALGVHTLEVEAIDAWDLPGVTADHDVEIVSP
jgi:hypothetical protein